MSDKERNQGEAADDGTSGAGKKKLEIEAEVREGEGGKGMMIVPVPSKAEHGPIEPAGQ